MMLSMYRIAVSVCLCTVVYGRIQLKSRDDCDKDFVKCSPKGASSSNAPAIGSALSPLYVDLLDSINEGQKVKRSAQSDLQMLDVRASTSYACCAEGTQCLLLEDFFIPFCYDNYTTNYLLPGGAYGQIVSGNYTSSDGNANLLTGDYSMNDGSSGNIYTSTGAAAKPDTATLAIPTQYTAAGVGSAIPATALGEWTTYTTTFPATTIPPTTVAATVLPASVSNGETVEPATTEPAETLAGTTIAPKTSTITAHRTKATDDSNNASHQQTATGPYRAGFWISLTALVVMAIL